MDSSAVQHALSFDGFWDENDSQAAEGEDPDDEEPQDDDLATETQQDFDDPDDQGGAGSSDGYTDGGGASPDSKYDDYDSPTQDDDDGDYGDPDSDTWESHSVDDASDSLALGASSTLSFLVGDRLTQLSNLAVLLTSGFTPWPSLTLFSDRIGGGRASQSLLWRLCRSSPTLSTY